ncbi:MAG: GIY-YIG nuclease family protein [Eubacteriales bacterium]
MESKYFTYIVRCRNGVLYTGYTNDVDRRVKKHNQSKGAKFTRGRGPIEVVYTEKFCTKGEAMVREAEIKRLTRPEKLKLIAVMENDGGH